MYKALIAAVVLATFTGLLGYAIGVDSTQSTMDVAVKMAYTLPNSSAQDELMNSLIFSDYMNGKISEEDAGDMFVTSFDKTLEVPLNVAGWGSITIAPYDPRNDPNAKPDSPYGTSSCIEEEIDGSIGCTIVEKSKVKCVVAMIIEKGPVAGTYCFVKECDGIQIAHRVKAPFDGYIVHYDTLIKVK